LLDHIEIDLRGQNSLLTVHIDVADNTLSRKWLTALNDIIRTDLHLEKNYCWMGWTESERNAQYLCEQINASIDHINRSGIGYCIDCDAYTVENTIEPGIIGTNLIIGGVVHEKMNNLHRYFEDLQGWSGGISNYYTRADPATRWHIRQEPADYELFGVETINRTLGGVYLGVNKAVGKHHWEVFNDEGRDSRVGELVTTGLRAQTEAAGDFDIEWARDPGAYHWQIKKLQEFRAWLLDNGFDPEDKSLTIGHPKVAQVDVMRTFGTTDYEKIWAQLAQHLDVLSIRTGWGEATYNYRWSDPDYHEQQIRRLK